MLLFSAVLSMLTPILPPPTVPVDSVKVEFTFERMEPGTSTSPKTSYFYHLSIQNNSNDAVYVIVPRWFESDPSVNGMMKTCDNDSHDGVVEYSFYADPSFEIYSIGPHAKMVDDLCKIRSKNDAVLKMKSIDLSVYIVHDIKVGELKLNDYMGHKAFYGDNLTYELVDVGSTHLNVSLK